MWGCRCRRVSARAPRSTSPPVPDSPCTAPLPALQPSKATPATGPALPPKLFSGREILLQKIGIDFEPQPRTRRHRQSSLAHFWRPARGHALDVMTGPSQLALRPVEVLD